MAERKIGFRIEALGTDKLSQDIVSLESQMQKLVARRKELVKQAKDGKISEQQLAKGLADVKIQTAQVSKEQANLKRSFTQGVQAANGVKGSYNQLVAETNKLRQQLKNLPNGFSATNKEAAKLKGQIAQNTAQLKEFDKGIGDNFRNVGNYGDAIQGAFSQMGLFSRELQLLTTLQGGVKAATQGSTGAMRVFKVALASTGIGALVVAIGSLIAAFKSSEEGQDKLNKIMEVTGVIVGNVSDLFAKLGEVIIEALENPQEVITGFANLIKDNITNRVVGLVELFPKLGEAIELTFKGQFSEAAEVSANAIAKATIGVEDLTGKIVSGYESATDAVTGFIEETDKEIEQAKIVADLTAETDRLEREQIKNRAKLESEIAELRLKARQEDQFSNEERKQFLIEANNLSNQLLDTDVVIAKNRAEIIKQQNSFSKSTKENLDAEAEAVARVNRVETARLNAQRQIQRELNTLNNQVAAEKKALRQQEEKEIQEEEALKQEQDLAKREVEIETLKLRAEENLALQLEILQKERDLLLENDELTAEQRLLIQEQFQVQRRKTEEEDAKRRIAAEHKLAAAQIGAASNVVSTISTLAKEGSAVAKATFVLEKGLALAQVAINLQKELALINANPVVNADLTQATRTALITGAIARGVGIVASIKAAKFARGGLTEGGMFEGNSHANGGIKFAAGGRVMEAEGGEAIINKRSTAMFKPMLSAINSYKGFGKKFADGGLVPATFSANALSGGNVNVTNDLSGVESQISAIKDAFKDIKVKNVVSETNDAIISIDNIQSEATL